MRRIAYQGDRRAEPRYVVFADRWPARFLLSGGDCAASEVWRSLLWHSATKRNKARQPTTPPRLVFETSLSFPLSHRERGPGGEASCRLRRLTTTGLWLVLGFERTEDVAGAAPRAHQLGIIAEPIPHHPVERANLFLDLGGHSLEIGACTHMIAPARPRGFDGLLQSAERTGEIVQQRRRHAAAQEHILLPRRLLQHISPRGEQRQMAGIGWRHLKLHRRLTVLGISESTERPQIQEQLALQRPPDSLPVLRGQAGRHHPRSLLPVERLRSSDQLLELREPESFPYSVRLVGPEKVPDPPGHF